MLLLNSEEEIDLKSHGLIEKELGICDFILEMTIDKAEERGPCNTK